VGAALYGGAVISSWDGTKASLIPCDPPDLPIVVAVPKQPLSTKLARKCLPSFYAKEDVVLSSSRANLLVAVLFAKRWDLLSVAMRDGFHQPYREPLVPGLKEVLKNAEKHGAYGAALSGAGPTIIVFARDEKRVASYLTKVFAELKVPVEIMELKPCHQGALVQLTERQNHSKVVEKI
jgi:homoserine kinase